MKLPPLPEESILRVVIRHSDRYGCVYGYTAKQLKDYAEEAVADYAKTVSDLERTIEQMEVEAKEAE